MRKFFGFIHLEEKTVQKLTKIAFVVFVLSVAFSFVHDLNFLEKNKSFTSFSFYNIYLIDLAAIFLIAVALINPYWHKKSILTPWLIFPAFAFLSFLWSGAPFLSAFWGLRLLLVVSALVVAVGLMEKEKYYNWFFNILIAMGVVESLIAVGQFIFQKSLGLYLLGESHLGEAVLGLPRMNILGHSLLRAYGTLPHSNILGGFLLFTIVATFWYKPAKYQGLYLTIQLIGLGLTFSRSAILGLFLILLLNWKRLPVFFAQRFNWREKKNFFALMLVVLLAIILVRSPVQNILSGRDPSTRLRVEYARAAFGRFLDSPIIGRGWGTGPVELPAYSNYPFYSWEIQPVHNIFLLALSDLGIIGLIILLYLVYQALKGPRSIWHSLFIAYLFIGLFDHYFLTLPQGIFIFFAAAMFARPAEARQRRAMAGVFALEKNREKTRPRVGSSRTSLPSG